MPDIPSQEEVPSCVKPSPRNKCHHVQKIPPPPKSTFLSEIPSLEEIHAFLCVTVRSTHPPSHPKYLHVPEIPSHHEYLCVLEIPSHREKYLHKSEIPSQQKILS